MTECTISLTDARQSFSAVIDRVQQRNEQVVVCRHHKPAAAIVPMHDKELLDGLDDLVDLTVAVDALEEIAAEGTISLADLRRRLGL